MRGEYMGAAKTSRLVTVVKIHGVFAQSKEILLEHGLVAVVSRPNRVVSVDRSAIYDHITFSRPNATLIHARSCQGVAEGQRSNPPKGQPRY